VAFVLLLLSATGAFAKPKPTRYCYHVSLSMWGTVILPEQTICVPPDLGVPPGSIAPV
jgi:hypothetical protein